MRLKQVKFQLKSRAILYFTESAFVCYLSHKKRPAILSKSFYPNFLKHY
ncbi:hypothetical protein CHY_2504 [Carboxydothermus hydrogenoformans Z-2901]|uniref:Uncharacterized protein n=1 Tax=Carboxydothermus hydrogenoformans (strain ATCC BAA-161 / DSM 6008 / Z-2901) TaxID=246194 RepID=Q3A986_CARHZ|nr:hypothetical protein CHY_2504 [Carboxydothermus hydrogenoformans Z-2901]